MSTYHVQTEETVRRWWTVEADSAASAEEAVMDGNADPEDGTGDIIERDVIHVQGPLVLQSPRCPDCGEGGEVRGHMGCQFPRDD